MSKLINFKNFEDAYKFWTVFADFSSFCLIRVSLTKEKCI